MNELIKLQPQTMNSNTVDTVSARELHAFLEVQTRFNDWIKNRIKQYNFMENQDFVCVSENSETQRVYIKCIPLRKFRSEQPKVL